MKLKIIGVTMVVLTSCGYMFNEVFLPQNCQKCEVISRSGSVVWTDDGCGGNTHQMELHCKAQAYDEQGTCNCERYKTEKTK